MSESYTMNEFCIALDMDKILNSLECTSQSHCFRKVMSLIQSMAPKILSLIAPRAWYCFMEMDTGEEIVVCLLTLGSGIDEYMRELIKKQGSFAYLAGDAVLQDYMFQMDEAIIQNIETICKRKTTGIIRRLNPPADYPWEGQRWILDTVQSRVSTGVTLTENYIFAPNYTMGYILLLGDEKEGYHGRHDCSKCTCQSCGRKRIGSSAD